MPCCAIMHAQLSTKFCVPAQDDDIGLVWGQHQCLSQLEGEKQTRQELAKAFQQTNSNLAMHEAEEGNSGDGFLMPVTADFHTMRLGIGEST